MLFGLTVNAKTKLQKELCDSQTLKNAQFRKSLQTTLSQDEVHRIGVGTVGALAPAMLKLQGQKYLFDPTIICQVYLLVDSQSSISLSLFI